MGVRMNGRGGQPIDPVSAEELARTFERKGGIRGFLSDARLSVVTEGHSAKPLLLVSLVAALDTLDASAASVLSPEIKDYFGLSLTGIGIVLGLTGLLTLLIVIPIGFYADRWKRTTMTSVGAFGLAAFSVLSGLAPTILIFGIARFMAGLAKSLDAVHTSLLADYYPPQSRAGIYSYRAIALRLSSMAAPVIAGGLAALFFWQVPFLLFAIPGAFAGYMMLRLREPVRGEQERRAMGASDDVAQTAERAPSFAESFRIAFHVRTLRRIWYSLPFLLGGLLAMGPLFALYYDEVFNLGPGARGVLAAANDGAAVAGLLLGGIVGGRLLRYRPGRVVTYSGLLAMLSGITITGLAMAPNLPVAVSLALAGTFVGAVLGPASSALMSLVIPARARTLALSIGSLFVVPGLVFLPIAGGVGDAFGIRIGILVMVPVFMLGAAILASAGLSVDADIRSANAAAMAAAISRKAREEGKAKLLVCTDVDVSYDQVQVLFGVDFEVEEGEIIALLGTNGAGKSTLLRAIEGLTPPSNGAIFYDGEDITNLPPNEHVGRGIVIVSGGRGIFPGLTVAENLQLAVWGARKDPGDTGDAMERVLGFFPILQDRSGELAGNLSGGEQQMLALSQAFLTRPRLLMIDELSLGLSPQVIEQLLAAVKAMHARGTTVLLVEQSVNLALTVAERAVFMEKGEVRFSGPTTELLGRNDILRSVFLKGTGSTAGRIILPASGDRAGGETPSVVMEVKQVTRSFGGVRALDQVSLLLEESQVLGLIGPNGAGKSSLFDVISGFLEPEEGRVLLFGTDVTELGPDERAWLGLQRSFQDARLFPALTVAENIAVALERHLDVRSHVLAALLLPQVRRAERKASRRVDYLIELMKLGDYRNKFVRELSTGTRRILDLACMLAAAPKVILLDEPSSGIAQSEAEELGPALLRIRQETKCSMLIIEHDMPLILSVSDELVAMDLGSIVTRGAPEDVIEHPRVVESYLGTSEETIRRSG